MACFSTRVSLRWVPDPATEYTDTLVMTTPGDHFVDIRVKTPFTSTPLESDFDWIITGLEYHVPGTAKTEFRHEISSHLKEKHGQAADVGEFSSLENGDRLEVGEMENWNTGEVQAYEEVWRNIDPLKSTPGNYVRDTKENVKKCDIICYHVKTEQWLGMSIKIGRWAQGAVLDKSKTVISAARWYYNDQGQWEVVFKSGEDADKIPAFGEEKQGETVNVSGLEWTVLESTY